MKTNVLLALAVLLVSLTLVAYAVRSRMPSPQPETYTAYGYVRSVSLQSHFFDNTHTIIAFEGDDGRLITIKFRSVEPRLWQGAHVKIIYHAVSFCESDGQRMFKLVSVEHLDRSR